MRSLHCLHVQVTAAVLLLDCGIATVCQGARAPVAQASDVVLITAKVLRLRFGFEAAVVVVYDLPDDLVVLHGATAMAALAAATRKSATSSITAIPNTSRGNVKMTKRLCNIIIKDRYSRSCRVPSAFGLQPDCGDGDGSKCEQKFYKGVGQNNHMTQLQRACIVVQALASTLKDPYM